VAAGCPLENGRVLIDLDGYTAEHVRIALRTDGSTASGFSIRFAKEEEVRVAVVKGKADLEVPRSPQKPWPPGPC
jgi:hypothetical protein